MAISLKLFLALALFFSKATAAPAVDYPFVDAIPSDIALANIARSSAAAAKSKPGLAYSPYNDNGTCKTRAQVFADLDHLRDFRLIRSYGTSCDQVRNILDAARPHGIKVFLGIYDIAHTNTQTQELIRAVNGDWGAVDTVSIGNEHVQSGRIDAASMAAQVNGARRILRAAGFNGPVVTIDTFDAVIRNPALCIASDYAAVNIHPWFDWNTAARGAGVFLADQINRVAAACPGKNVIVTETGWPHRGDTHGSAVASRVDQEVAVRALYGVTGNMGIFLGPFDDLWKSNNGGTFGSEQFWGISNFNVFRTVS